MWQQHPPLTSDLGSQAPSRLLRSVICTRLWVTLHTRQDERKQILTVGGPSRLRKHYALFPCDALPSVPSTGSQPLSRTSFGPSSGVTQQVFVKESLMAPVLDGTL